MKKILFLIHALNFGGAQRALVDMVNHMDLDKYDITIQAISHREGLQPQLDSRVHYKTIVKTNNKFFKKTYLFFIRRILNLKWVYNRFVDDNYDYEVAYLEGETTRLLSYSTNKKAKKYAWVHTDMVSNFTSQGLYKNLDNHIEAYKKYDNIVCVSKSVKDSVAKRFGIDKNVLVKYNICNEEVILKKSLEQVCDFENSSVMKFITVSNLRPEKRHFMLLRVLARLKEENYKFFLHIVGDGSERENIIKTIDELNLNDCVKLLGNRSNPYPYMKKSDLMIICSKMEGYSSVAVEASLVELPTLTTDCGGMREVFDDGQLGIIVENNEEALYKGIKEVLDNVSIIEKYKALLNENREKFGVINKINEIEKLFEE